MLMQEFTEMLGGPGMRDEFARLFSQALNSKEADKELTEEASPYRRVQKMRETTCDSDASLWSLPSSPPDPGWLN